MNFKSLPDDILLLHLRMGEEMAFHEIYLRYWQKLYGIANNKTRSTKIAEEITQDVFLKLWEGRRNLKIERLEYYLLASVKNAIINHYRTMHTHEKFIEYAQNEYAKSELSTEKQLDLNELISKINEHLNDMPYKTRLIFNLNRLQYYSVKEISAQLNIPERTVEYHIAQAIKILKTHLKEYLPALFLFLLR
ncbi:MAG: RNA polymerase sigma factor [Emticicia sp.]|uniref:RNA polymerase sigma factor n=1 Tax=Emticicia sp. TaxID=1930953 RepID=UPI003BA48A74